MKKIFPIIGMFFLVAITYILYKNLYMREDELAYIFTGEGIIEQHNSGNLVNLETNYKDRLYAADFLDFCYALESNALDSDFFLNFSQISKLKNYMKSTNISEPKDCIEGKNLEESTLKEECIFHGDDGLHNPYIAAYLNNDISDSRFQESMNLLGDYYIKDYPNNGYILKVLAEKSKSINITKLYCDNILSENINDFIKSK